VICSGMGRRAVEALNVEGIKTYYSASKSVREILGQFKENKLVEMDPQKACRGHGQRAGHDQTPEGCAHGRGQGYGRGPGPGTGGRGN